MDKALIGALLFCLSSWMVFGAVGESGLLPATWSWVFAYVFVIAGGALLVWSVWDFGSTDPRIIWVLVASTLLALMLFTMALTDSVGFVQAWASLVGAVLVGIASSHGAFERSASKSSEDRSSPCDVAGER